MTQLENPDYNSRLRSFIPDFYWFRHFHGKNSASFFVEGSMIARSETAFRNLAANINNEEASCHFIEVDDYTNDKFWFLPVACRRGVRLEVKADVARDSINFVRLGTSARDVALIAPFGHGGDFICIGDTNSLGGAPPTDAIERVSGKGATSFSYFNNGTTDYYRFKNLSAQYGMNIENKNVRILDWGCGCGRLTRHLLSLPSGARRVTGIDIDQVNIAWNQQHLSDSQFLTVDLMPPTPFPDDSFDLVIANSVLSHLKLDVAKAWIAEIRRLLAPGGLALLSYHGEFSLAATASKTPNFVESVLETGFNSDLSAKELNEILADPGYYRQTFMSDIFANKLFSESFDLLDQVKGVVSRFQNLAVCR